MAFHLKCQDWLIGQYVTEFLRSVPGRLLCRSECDDRRPCRGIPKVKNVITPQLYLQMQKAGSRPEPMN